MRVKISPIYVIFCLWTPALPPAYANSPPCAPEGNASAPSVQSIAELEQGISSRTGSQLILCFSKKEFREDIELSLTTMVAALEKEEPQAVMKLEEETCINSALVRDKNHLASIIHRMGGTRELALRIASQSIDRTHAENNNALAASPALEEIRPVEYTLRTAAGAGIGVLAARQLYPGQSDKVKHVAAGAAVAAVTDLLQRMNGVEDEKTLFLRDAGASLVVGLLKEIYDSRHRKKHTSDPQDALATGMGGLTTAASLNIHF